MRISEALDFLKTDNHWSWSVIVACSWACFGSALYFMAVQGALFEFTYHPNEFGIISPTTIACIPKSARLFYFLFGTVFVAGIGILGWLTWVRWCAFLTHSSGRSAQKVFSMDAYGNLILLIAFVDIIYRFLPYTVAVSMSLVALAVCRVAMFRCFRKKSLD